MKVFHNYMFAFNLARSYSTSTPQPYLVSHTYLYPLSLVVICCFLSSPPVLHFLCQLKGIQQTGEWGRGQQISGLFTTSALTPTVHFLSQLLFSSSGPWPAPLCPTLFLLLPALPLTPPPTSHFGMIDDHDALLLGSLLTSWSRAR